MNTTPITLDTDFIADLPIAIINSMAAAAINYFIYRGSAISGDEPYQVTLIRSLATRIHQYKHEGGPMPTPLIGADEFAVQFSAEDNLIMAKAGYKFGYRYQLDLQKPFNERTYDTSVGDVVREIAKGCHFKWPTKLAPYPPYYEMKLPFDLWDAVNVPNDVPTIDALT